MPRQKKKPEGYATIDVALVVLRTGAEEGGVEIAIDTASKLGVEVVTETQEGVKHIKNGRLLAQKRSKTVITGTKLTLTDNIFYPDVMKILQGGSVSGTGDSQTYTPPVSGSDEEGEIFEVDAYSAIYDTDGIVKGYEVITYPNCQGTPVAINSEDNVFRLPEYVINSAPSKGQPAYNLKRVKALPDFNSEAMAVTYDGTALSETNGDETSPAILG